MAVTSIESVIVSSVSTIYEENALCLQNRLTKPVSSKFPQRVTRCRVERRALGSSSGTQLATTTPFSSFHAYTPTGSSSSHADAGCAEGYIGAEKQ